MPRSGLQSQVDVSFWHATTAYGGKLHLHWPPIVGYTLEWMRFSAQGKPEVVNAGHLVKLTCTFHPNLWRQVVVRLDLQTASEKEQGPDSLAAMQNVRNPETNMPWWMVSGTSSFARRLHIRTEVLHIHRVRQ